MKHIRQPPQNQIWIWDPLVSLAVRLSWNNPMRTPRDIMIKTIDLGKPGVWFCLRGTQLFSEWMTEPGSHVLKKQSGSHVLTSSVPSKKTYGSWMLSTPGSLANIFPSFCSGIHLPNCWFRELPRPKCCATKEPLLHQNDPKLWWKPSISCKKSWNCRCFISWSRPAVNLHPSIPFPCALP